MAEGFIPLVAKLTQCEVPFDYAATLIDMGIYDPEVISRGYLEAIDKTLLLEVFSKV
jgi:hypothetical protein